MNWDSYIENDGEMKFVTLPEGDYDFTVTGFEKGEYSGSSKIPACPKAMLEMTFEVKGVGKAVVKENIYIDESVEWKICEFFRCIGLRKHGERTRMPWDQVIGKTGTAHLIVNDWIDNDGNNRQNNRISRFLDPEREKLPWEDSIG